MPASAGHSFNGVTFVLRAKCGVVVTAVRTGGELGRVRVFAGRHNDAPIKDWRQWILIASATLEPNWTVGSDIVFHLPVPLRAGTACKFLVFSEVPGDRGITYAADSRAYEDDHVSLLHGEGYIGTAPFLIEGGWTRSPRGLSGAVEYSVVTDTYTLERFARLEQSFACRLPSRDELHSNVGGANRQLLSEAVHGRVVDPLVSGTPAAIFSIAAGAGGNLSGLTQLADVCQAPPAIRALWRRYLGKDNWLADAHEAITQAQLTDEPAASVSLARVLASRRRRQLSAPSHGGGGALRKLLAAALSPAERVRRAIETAVEAPPGAPFSTALTVAANSVDAALRARWRSFADSSKLRACCAQLAYAAPLRTPLSLCGFVILRYVHTSRAATVCACRKEDSGAVVALKLFRRNRLSPSATERLCIERRLLERVARRRSAFLSGLLYAFQTTCHAALALPFLPGGTLQTQIVERARSQGGLPVADLTFVAACLAAGISHLHEIRILHRDIKPNNVLVRSDGYYVLSDYGLSSDLQTASSEELRDRRGTRGYWAPEVLLREDAQGPAADWWSYGVTLAHAAAGRHPFKDEQALDTAPVELGEGGHEERRIGEGGHEERMIGEGGHEERMIGEGGHDEPPATQRATDAKEQEAQRVDERTLHAPIAVIAPTESLAAFIRGLITRDAGARLGSKSAEAVLQHPCFASVDWKRLERRALPAPWLPDAQVVYIPDVVARPSHTSSDETPAAAAPQPAVATGVTQETAPHAPRPGLLLHEWDYWPSLEDFAEHELASFVAKAPSLASVLTTAANAQLV